MATPPRLATLPEIEAAVWRELAQATQQRGHAWRTATLATVAMADDGTPQPEARSVVLRDCDAAARRLLVYTDDRSAKAMQARQWPAGVIVCWSPPLAWQLRLHTRLELHTHGLMVSSRWAQLKLTPAAQDYLSPLPPGAPLDAPPVPERGTREHFAVVECQVESLDWLELHADGHRRARFDGAGARWLNP